MILLVHPFCPSLHHRCIHVHVHVRTSILGNGRHIQNLQSSGGSGFQVPFDTIPENHCFSYGVHFGLWFFLGAICAQSLWYVRTFVHLTEGASAGAGAYWDSSFWDWRNCHLWILCCRARFQHSLERVQRLCYVLHQFYSWRLIVFVFVLVLVQARVQVQVPESVGLLLLLHDFDLDLWIPAPVYNSL